MISSDPKEERWFRRAAVIMLISMAALLMLRACHALCPDANWRGPLSIFESRVRCLFHLECHT